MSCLRITLCWLVFGFLLPGLCGCRTWDQEMLQEDGFHDSQAGWSKNLRRSEESGGTALGTSTKAREVERNLGYR